MEQWLDPDSYDGWHPEPVEPVDPVEVYAAVGTG